MFGKSQALEFLSKKSISASILPQVVITDTCDVDLVKSRLNKLDCIDYAVRSNSSNEDGDIRSNAGKFNSLLNVHEDEVIDAINHVVSKYEHEAEPRVLVQPHAQRCFCIRCCIFT